MARRRAVRKPLLKLVRQFENELGQIEQKRVAETNGVRRERQRFPETVTHEMMRALIEQLILTRGQVDIEKFLKAAKKVYEGFPEEYQSFKRSAVAAYAVSQAVFGSPPSSQDLQRMVKRHKSDKAIASAQLALDLERLTTQLEDAGMDP